MVYLKTQHLRNPLSAQNDDIADFKRQPVYKSILTCSQQNIEMSDYDDCDDDYDDYYGGYHGDDDHYDEDDDDDGTEEGEDDYYDDWQDLLEENYSGRMFLICSL